MIMLFQSKPAVQRGYEWAESEHKKGTPLSDIAAKAYGSSDQFDKGVMRFLSDKGYDCEL
jgi:hypothetical protein